MVNISDIQKIDKATEVFLKSIWYCDWPPKQHQCEGIETEEFKKAMRNALVTIGVIHE